MAYQQTLVLFVLVCLRVLTEEWFLQVFAELILGQPLFTGKDGVDQLVQIIKVLGTPTAQQLRLGIPGMWTGGARNSVVEETYVGRMCSFESFQFLQGMSMCLIQFSIVFIGSPTCRGSFPHAVDDQIIFNTHRMLRLHICLASEAMKRCDAPGAMNPNYPEYEFTPSFSQLTLRASRVWLG